MPLHAGGEVGRLTDGQIYQLWAQGHRADAFKDYRKFLLEEISKLKEEVTNEQED